MAEERTSLLDDLAQYMRCTCLSDLRDVPQKKQRALIWKLESIPPVRYSLAAWNDALTYLTGEPAAATSEAARAALIHYYSKI